MNKMRSKRELSFSIVFFISFLVHYRFSHVENSRINIPLFY
jgi:hypothetical protein